MPSLDCGHDAKHVAGNPGNTQCWDCHIQNLRLNGQYRKADRLTVLRRQQDEGRLDIEKRRSGLIDSLIEAYKDGLPPDDGWRNKEYKEYKND